MSRRDAIITGVLLGLMCLVIAGIVVNRRDPFSDPVGNLALPVSEPTLAGGDDEAELQEFVDEAILFIEGVRGRSFIERPNVIVMPEAEFAARVDGDLEAGFAESPEDLEIANAQFRSLGLIDPTESIDDVSRTFSGAGVLGFYDPETDELVVRERDGLTLLTKRTIIHELVHAFDDQHFDLARPEYDDLEDEIPWTFLAVIEGSATWVESEWKATLTPDEIREMEEEEASFVDVDLFLQFEYAFLLLQLSPYTSGEVFVDHIVEAGGTAALDAALEEPPPTSEQVLEPDAFDRAEPAVDVDLPEADGEVLWSGIGGQVLVDALFEGNFVFAEVDWGGDAMIVWVDDIGRSCVRWDIQADDAAGQAELVSGFEQWGVVVGSTRITTPDGITIRVERCA